MSQSVHVPTVIATTYTSNFQINHIFSIGSLGMYGSEAKVEQIYVFYCQFFNTMNGVRIKTWQVTNYLSWIAIVISYFLLILRVLLH